jgi:hypothetical protein
MDVLSASSVVGGVVLGQTFLFAAEPRGMVIVIVPMAVLAAIGAIWVVPALQAGLEWISAFVVLSAATMLAEGRYARVGAAAAALMLVPAVVAASSFLEVAWSSVPLSRAGAACTVVVGAGIGASLRSFRRKTTFGDLALLALLCSLGLMAAPTAYLGWARASVAAEGDESTFIPPSLTWLLPVGAAFLAGFAWRAWRVIEQIRKQHEHG